MEAPGFWQDSKSSTEVIKGIKLLKAKVQPFYDVEKKLKDIDELIALGASQDSELLGSLGRDLEAIKNEVSSLESKVLLNGEFDANNAILSINAGAGGTESCDWVGMLLRMYCRFAQGKGFKAKVADILEGEEAGIKNVTVFIEGPYSYGYLKSENGVHRLVRISPFDANKRRHTSFASVSVIPQIEEDMDITLQEKDLKIDVYRSSGPGGQSVNTTDSAVRITHIPSGIVVQCQNERSQYQNKQNALSILKARLYDIQRQEQEEKVKSEHSKKRKIEWGSQVRSYVMHPYSMVKDHRTDCQTGNVSAIMDGKLDDFIDAYLRRQRTETI